MSSHVCQGKWKVMHRDGLAMGNERKGKINQEDLWEWGKGKEENESETENKVKGWGGEIYIMTENGVTWEEGLVLNQDKGSLRHPVM